LRNMDRPVLRLHRHIAGNTLDGDGTIASIGIHIRVHVADGDRSVVSLELDRRTARHRNHEVHHPAAIVRTGAADGAPADDWMPHGKAPLAGCRILSCYQLANVHLHRVAGGTLQRDAAIVRAVYRDVLQTGGQRLLFLSFERGFAIERSMALITLVRY